MVVAPDSPQTKQDLQGSRKNIVATPKHPRALGFLPALGKNSNLPAAKRKLQTHLASSQSYQILERWGWVTNRKQTKNVHGKDLGWEMSLHSKFLPPFQLSEQLLSDSQGPSRINGLENSGPHSLLPILVKVRFCLAHRNLQTCTFEADPNIPGTLHMKQDSFPNLPLMCACEVSCVSVKMNPSNVR